MAQSGHRKRESSPGSLEARPTRRHVAGGALPLFRKRPGRVILRIPASAFLLLFTTGAFIEHDARAEVVVRHFFSPALGVVKHVFVYLPPSYSTHPRR